MSYARPQTVLLTTLARGTRYMQHTFKTAGTSLHPLQRAGLASADTLHVPRNASPVGFGAQSPAAETNIANPPVFSVVNGVHASMHPNNIL